MTSSTQKELAHNIFLWRHETDNEIVYELDNAKYKDIRFKMDFSGSQNLALTTGGNTILTKVSPYKRVVVGVLKVRNTRATSQLRVKYTWEEMDPCSPPSGTPKKEELGPGIFLHTKRTTDPDTFVYSISYKNYGSRLKFTINFSGSQNLYFDSGSLTKTMRVEAYETVLLGTLRPIVPSNSWSLKTKYTWSEEQVSRGMERMGTTVVAAKKISPRVIARPVTTRPIAPTAPTAPTAPYTPYTPYTAAYQAPAPHFGSAPLPPTPSRVVVQAPPPPTRRHVNATRTNPVSLERTALQTPDVKKQIIADKIELTTTRVDDGRTGHSIFTFEVDNMKYKDLNVVLDFNGSTNLLLDIGTLKTSVRVMPYERRIVGVLKTVHGTHHGDRTNGGWSLKQKVSVEQLEPTPQQRIEPNRGTRGNTKDVAQLRHERNPRRTGAGGQNAKRLTVSARDKVMAASKKTQFYRRASLNRGDSPAVPVGGSPTPASLLFAPPPGVNVAAAPKVLSLLSSINMKQYWPLFLSEAMDDMKMLKSLAQDKTSFREALKEMGIFRMGHREIILNALLTT